MFDRTSERRAFRSNGIFPNTTESPRLLSSWFCGITHTVIRPQLAAACGLEGLSNECVSYLTCEGSLCASLSLPGLCVSALPVLRGSQMI